MNFNLKILLISGWGFGPQILEQVVNELEHYNFEVTLIDIFDPFDLPTLQEKVYLAQQHDVLMGWSLGGQLALFLANEVYLKTTHYKLVITCMSNPSFISRENWSDAMPTETFSAFANLVKTDFSQAMKRFCQLTTLGGTDSKKNARYLQEYISKYDLSYQKKYIDLLCQLNLVTILDNYCGKVLFIFSESDCLVSCKVSEKIANLSANYFQVLKISGAHDAILFDTKFIILQISNFIKANTVNSNIT